MENKRSSQDQFYFYNKETEQQAVDYPSGFTSWAWKCTWNERKIDIYVPVY